MERRTDYEPAGKTDYSQGSDNTRICEESEKVLTILLIIICGQKSKLKAPDFEDTISHHNMIVLTETKLDDLDSIHINNFKLINNNRKYRKKASGGVAVLVHNSISSYVTEMDIQFKYTLWISVSKTFHGKPLVIGVIYNPPEGSPYADPTVFDFLEETIADIKGKDESTDICLMGDFNARTAKLSDIMDNDDDLDVLNMTADAYIPALRTNMDCHVNNSCKRLISLCKNIGMYILNGRCHNDKDLGKFTCKNASVVDYVICTDELFNRIADFYVDQFDLLLSDIHCPIIFKISTQVHIDTNKKPHEQVSINNHDTCEENTSELTYTKWNSENKTFFNQFFDTERFNNILQLLEDINHKDNIQQKYVNDITKNISNIHTQAVDYAGMLRQRNPHNKQSTRRLKGTHTPWYGAECETKRRIDLILNEFIKSFPDIIIEIIVMLFNVILDSEIIHTDWCLCIIKPIFKNKGDTRDPSNYRGITSLSCLGKLFTSCINTRLTSYSKSCDIIGNEQAGFKQGFSTTDHIFSLKTLIVMLYLLYLYCCFVDYSKAFDTVNRVALWSKLLEKGIGGKLIKSIYSMYNNAKSCISMSGKTSGYFACKTGVRQGENLSPLLFLICLSDLRDYLSTKYNEVLFINNNIFDLLNDINLDTY